jgi:hypothetical protein
MRNLFALSSIALFALVVAPAVAQAQTSVATSSPQDGGPPPAGVAADPNADRGFLLPTAQTQPAGTLTFNDYELVLVGLTYGVTDYLQVTGTVLPPFSQDMPTVAQVGAKLRMLDLPRLKLAAQASYWYLHVDVLDTSGSASLVEAGPIATLCIDAGCDSTLSASVTWVHPLAPQSSDGNHAFIYGASLQARVSRHLKLLAEVDSASAITQGTWDNAGGALVGYGVRFFDAKLAGDVGFLRPVGGGSTNLLLGVPFVSFTVRL